MTHEIAVMKIDTLAKIVTGALICILIGTYLIGSKIGVLEEKVAALEDIVFNAGVYEKLKVEVRNEKGRT